MELRPYQKQCLDKIQELLNTNPHKLNRYIVMPTGTGKTEIFMRITNKRILILENRSFLRDQIVERFSSICDDVLNIGSGIHLTNTLLINSSSKIVVATKQTLIKDLNNLSRDIFDIIIIDECHHSQSDITYKKILDYFDYKLCLGFTATPAETSTIFALDDKLFEQTIFEAWRDEYLMKPELFVLELSMDKSKLTRALNHICAQWRDEDITEAFISHTESNFKAILQQLVDMNNAEKCVVYFSSIQLSEQFSSYCMAHGHICYSVTSKTKIKDRNLYISEFENSRNVILSNVFCLAEGVDIPSIECILLARPTENKNIYKQIVGRALRLCKDKSTAKVCDCVVEQNDLLFQQTFVTAYCMPTKHEVILDKESIVELNNIINAKYEIEQVSNNLEQEFTICYDLIKKDKLYIDTCDIPYYIDTRKNIIYGKGICYNKKWNKWINKYVLDYSNIMYTIHFYIKKRNTDIYELRVLKKNVEIYTFSNLEQCFVFLSEKYCKYGQNIFKTNSYSRTKGTKTLTNKQQEILCDLVSESYSVNKNIAKHVFQAITKRKASDLINMLITRSYISKYLVD